MSVKGRRERLREGRRIDVAGGQQRLGVVDARRLAIHVVAEHIRRKDPTRLESLDPEAHAQPCLAQMTDSRSPFRRLPPEISSHRCFPCGILRLWCSGPDGE